jgi:transmembrane 9 superfamily protein 2/4
MASLPSLEVVVVLQLSDTKWASRWDAYLKMPRGQVHWFSIINSLVVALVLSGVVMVILLRTVRRDLIKCAATLHPH